MNESKIFVKNFDKKKILVIRKKGFVKKKHFSDKKNML